QGRLQLLESARHGGDLERHLSPVDPDFRLFGKEVERDVRLTGEEVAGAQLCAQPAIDEVLQRFGAPPRVVRRSALAETLGETLRADVHFHPRHYRALGVVAVLTY